MSTKKISGMIPAGVLAAGPLTACGSPGTTSTTAADVATVASGNSQAVADITTAAGEKRTLGVAAERAYAPYNWAQPDDSNGVAPTADNNKFAYGYDAMMAEKICNELGYDPEIVRLDWDSLIPAITTGKVDCVIVGQSITFERLQVADFTGPYYYATIVTLAKEGSKYTDVKSAVDLVGATRTSQQSIIWYNTCLLQIEGANVLAIAASAPDTLMPLNVDKCDLVVIDQPTGKGALVAYPNFKMIEFGGGENDFQVADEDISIGISLKKGDTELQNAVNSVLTKVTKDDLFQMMDEATSIQPLTS